ncbi:BrnT family toxin [Erwinia mallotivora]|uniref:BrnT family toxin n=1 Tax=Erwinia mallotivora TaxID=69222 RepID=UPI0035E74EB3
MNIEYDQSKREKTLLERGIDFARATEVFAGIHFTAEDNRQDYGEVRNITVGKLDARLVVMVWTQRNQTRRIISMRKANEREIKRFEKYLG